MCTRGGHRNRAGRASRCFTTSTGEGLVSASRPDSRGEERVPGWISSTHLHGSLQTGGSSVLCTHSAPQLGHYIGHSEKKRKKSLKWEQEPWAAMQRSPAACGQHEHSAEAEHYAGSRGAAPRKIHRPLSAEVTARPKSDAKRVFLWSKTINQRFKVHWK